MAGAREAYFEGDGARDSAESTTSLERRHGMEVLSSTADIGSAASGMQGNMAPAVALPDAELPQALVRRCGVEVLSSTADIGAATRVFNSNMAAGVALPDAESAKSLPESLELRGGVEVLSSTAGISTATRGFKCNVAAIVPLPVAESDHSLDLRGGVEMRSSTAGVSTATAPVRGNMAPGVPPPTPASVLLVGGFGMERSVERIIPASVQCAGETPPHCDGVVGTNRSISSQEGAENTVESAPVPTMRAGLGAQNLLVAPGVCAGEGMVDKGPGAATTVTTECANCKHHTAWVVCWEEKVRRKRRVGVPIERHAEEIYTRAMYERFSNELYYSGSYSIRESLGGKEFKVAHYKERSGEEERYFTVRYDMMTIVTCSCGLFEHSGMLCKHCLKVLVHLEVTKIPPGNILPRWTKTATNDGSREGGDEDSLNAAITADYTRKHLLLKRVLAASGVDTMVCEAAAKSAISALEKLTSLNANSGMSNNVMLTADNSSTDGSRPYACPDRPLRKGRPTNTSLKSFQDGVKKQTMKRAWSDQSSRPSTTDEENPRSGKTRALDELI